MFAIDIALGLIAGLVAIYCYIISRKMSEFFKLENGMGNAIAIFSAQVDDLKSTLEKTNFAAHESSTKLQSLFERAQITEKNLEIMIASLQDIPEHTEDELGPREIRPPRNRIRRLSLRAAE